MALTALIAAYHESAEPGLLCAVLPLAGRTLVERQARSAVAAGATCVIVLVERMPPALGSALDRLRRDGIPLKVARSAEEAAQSISPGERLLLIGDGAVIDPSLLTSFARNNGALVLTVADTGLSETYERIDRDSRWAGLAAFDESLLRDTAASLGEWDLQSTLLRRALQSGAALQPADAPAAIIHAVDDLAGLERNMIAFAVRSRGGWAERMLAPAERAATLGLMASPVSASAIAGGAAALIGLGGLAFFNDWRWTGLFLLLLATPLEGISERLGRLRLMEEPGSSWWTMLLPLLSGGALLALGVTLSRSDGWGMFLLSVTTLFFLIASTFEQEGEEGIEGNVALAEPKGMTWLMLPFALFGGWHGGLALLFSYAIASFFWTQNRVHRRRRPGAAAGAAPIPQAGPPPDA